ncbi:hypothetical protein BDP27DRAFT_1412988 [Rhodocollybia butyracea]|uniref:Uncharacterized protein n=1 Tax=Rhodocollybia butyracea TaxID=206335 RepID=A0A9P5UFA4_9AGAR|nr:hypothetical protein BDP27DRAFT_1412988 [Rhodocollybia butyracea]
MSSMVAAVPLPQQDPEITSFITSTTTLPGQAPTGLATEVQGRETTTLPPAPTPYKSRAVAITNE